tara:strand:+ start:49 stop:189 length:141 start_codon:yes stop_codon:yes gene_type:complete
MKYLLILLSIFLFSFTVISCGESSETYEEYGHDDDDDDDDDDEKKP